MVKSKTEDASENKAKEEESEYDMAGFMKTKKECVNLKALEKTKKILDSIIDLMEKDSAFLENLDFVKVFFLSFYRCLGLWKCR